MSTDVEGSVAVSGDKSASMSLLIFILLSALIIISNFFIGLFAPTLVGLEDEISFFDTLWRVVAGQRAGIDYHNPMGFGPYQLGGLLWHWFGPHNFVMRLAIALFSLSIALCGCVVAQRVLAYRKDLALLFCVTVAFQLSAPSAYASSPVDLTIAEFYNRLIVSALAVLFLEVFGSDTIAYGESSGRTRAVGVILTALLLNILFLLKISGFLLGLMILLAGYLVHGRAANRILSLCTALFVFVVLIEIEFAAAGLEFIPIIKDYNVAAHARLAFTFYDIARGMISWPLAISLSLLALYVVSQPRGGPRLNLRWIGLIIGSYAVCQFSLNITNADPSMWLAPAAVASLAVCMELKPIAKQRFNSEIWWQTLAPSRFAEMSARNALPLVVLLVVLVPEIIASLAGIAAAEFTLLGIVEVYTITAGKGITFSTLVHPRQGPEVYERSLKDAVNTIVSLNLSHEAIANLDHSNPFPVLFLAPPPKGIHVWWNFGFNVPRDAVLGWQDVIGDACVVTIPKHPVTATERLTEVVQSKLATDFKMVHQDEMWTIYRRTQDCATAPRS